MPARARLGALLVIGACSYPNGRYLTEGDETASAGTTTSTATAGSTSTTTSTPSTTSTSDATTTSTTTAGETSIGSTSEGTTTTSEGTSSGTTGSTPEGCWGPGAGPWVVTALALPQAAAPRITASGLEMVYSALYDGYTRPWLTSRQSVLEPFPVGAPVTNWGVMQNVNRASLSPTGAELVMDIGANNDDDLYSSVDEGGVWSPPKKIPGLNLVGYHDQSPRLLEGGTRIYFHADRGPEVPLGFTGQTYRIYEAERPDGDPETPFGPIKPLEIAGITDDITFPHVLLSPAPTADGLHLFYSTSYPLHFDVNTAKDALNLYYTERASVDEPWTVGAPIEELDTMPGFWVSPDSVSGDGCQLYLRYWGGGGPFNYLATRTPGP
ncbi:MAG: hypothetical protein R3B09_00460 [Nannocystaceae bacterium]